MRMTTSAAKQEVRPYAALCDVRDEAKCYTPQQAKDLARMLGIYWTGTWTVDYISGKDTSARIRLVSIDQRTFWVKSISYDWSNAWTKKIGAP